MSTILLWLLLVVFKQNAGLKFHTLIVCIRTNTNNFIHTHSCDLDTTCSNGEVFFLHSWPLVHLHSKPLQVTIFLVTQNSPETTYNIHVGINYEVQL